MGRNNKISALSFLNYTMELIHFQNIVIEFSCRVEYVSCYWRIYVPGILTADNFPVLSRALLSTLLVTVPADWRLEWPITTAFFIDDDVNEDNDDCLFFACEPAVATLLVKVMFVWVREGKGALEGRYLVELLPPMVLVALMLLELVRLAPGPFVIPLAAMYDDDLAPTLLPTMLVLLLGVLRALILSLVLTLSPLPSPPCEAELPEAARNFERKEKEATESVAGPSED
jgi:hypothetical protein